MKTKKKPTGSCELKETSSSALSYFDPKFSDVASKVVAVDPSFIPKKLEDSNALVVFANLTNKTPIQLPYRSSVVVDCGLSLEMPVGFHLMVASIQSLAASGLVVTPTFVSNKRVEVVMNNIGHQIHKISHGQPIAHITVQRNFSDSVFE